MSNGYAGGDIGVKKKLLICYCIRLKGLAKHGHILKDLVKPTGKSGVRRRFNNAVINETELIFIAVDYAEANSSNSWVNSQHTHSILRG